MRQKKYYIYWAPALSVWSEPWEWMNGWQFEFVGDALNRYLLNITAISGAKLKSKEEFEEYMKTLGFIFIEPYQAKKLISMM